ncbi:MAG: NAD-dependent epimerase/dehydratase family protein [Gemmatimonadetes bacterium]|nr:NAD-dependent epimerase/dehydratase family protein [Gemmatimonadota bacterium]
MVRPGASIAVLGASGYVGQLLTQALGALPDGPRVLALDVRRPQAGLPPRVTFEEMDVRSARCGELLAEHEVEVVVHLAAVVNPPSGMSRNEQYAIDVDGTHNVLEACIEHGVRQVVVLSSAAAYGFHAGLPPLLDEGAPLRGNEEFPYARHKRLVEELLAKYRERHPELRQVVFRPATILGDGTRNSVTAIFERRVLFRLVDGEDRFGFIWDGDVVACIVQAICDDRAGTWNLAADGFLDLGEIGALTGATVIQVSSSTLASMLRVGQWLGFTEHGPEQVPYLRHRPVLSNRRLREEFGFVPTRTSREVFEGWWQARRRVRLARGA